MNQSSLAAGTLAGQRILVTGAGQGIGRAIALCVADAGGAVIVADVRPREAEQVARDLRARGADAEHLELDVSDPDDVRTKVTGLDISGLVCNAGVSGRMPLDHVTTDHWDRVIAVNLRGAFLCVQAASASLTRHKGAVVGIASSSAHQGVSTHSVYAASKGGLLAMFRALAAELAPDVRVNTISPGVVETALNAARLSDPREVQQSVARIPCGRLGQPPDVARVAIFLLSSAADWLTGGDIRVDGGETAT